MLEIFKFDKIYYKIINKLSRGAVFDYAVYDIYNVED